MRALIFVFAMILSEMAGGQQRPVEIDPNTKIQGGADLPGSSAAAGAGSRSDSKPTAGPRANDDDRRRDVAEPEKGTRPEDKPFTARKPSEQEEASKRQPAPLSR